MPTEFYVENWERTNKWLNENAPKYVLTVIEELATTMSDLGQRALKAEQAVNVIEKGFHKGMVAINELEQLTNEMRATREHASAQLNDLCDDLEAAEQAFDTDTTNDGT